MLYQMRLTVPAGTKRKQAVKKTIMIEEPILFYVGVKFPVGPSDLVYIAIFYGKYQLLPSKRGEWIAGDDEVVWDYPLLTLPDKPTKLTVMGYAPETAYDHTVLVRFIALPKPYIAWMIAISRLAEAFKQFFKLVGMVG